MDPLVTGDAEPEPTIPRGVARRLMRLFGAHTLEVLIEHAEIVECKGHGQLTVTWRDGKPDLVYHQASDRV